MPQIDRFGTARSRFICLAALAGCVLLGPLAPRAKAQAPELNQPPRPPARAANAAPHLARPLDPAQQQHLDEMLEAWSIKSRSVNDLKGMFNRQTIDQVYHTEERVWGVVYYMAPDKARMDLYDKDGKVIEHQFYCTGSIVYEVRHRNKQIIEHRLPHGQQGVNLNQGPLPFLFGMTPEQIKRRYEIQIVHENGERVLVKAFPRLPEDQQNFRVAELILNKSTWLPEQLALQDVNKDVQKYVFPRGIQVNTTIPASYFEQPKRLPGFRQIVNEVGQEEQPGQEKSAAAPRKGGFFRRSK